jgi:hypothetical protein
MTEGCSTLVQCTKLSLSAVDWLTLSYHYVSGDCFRKANLMEQGAAKGWVKGLTFAPERFVFEM